LPAASSGPPEGKPERVAPGRRERRTPCCSALLPMGFTEPGRSPGLLVSSYLTVSPLPPTNADGGLFSVALSLAFRPVGVTHHRTLWSPDFPPVTLNLAQNMHPPRETGDHPARSDQQNRCTAKGSWQATAGLPPKSDFSNATLVGIVWLSGVRWLIQKCWTVPAIAAP